MPGVTAVLALISVAYLAPVTNPAENLAGTVTDQLVARVLTGLLTDPGAYVAYVGAQ